MYVMIISKGCGCLIIPTVQFSKNNSQCSQYCHSVTIALNIHYRINKNKSHYRLYKKIIIQDIKDNDLYVIKYMRIKRLKKEKIDEVPYQLVP